MIIGIRRQVSRSLILENEGGPVFSTAERSGRLAIWVMSWGSNESNLLEKGTKIVIMGTRNRTSVDERRESASETKQG